MSYAIVRVLCDSVGLPTPHDGRYVVDWNPHTEFGTCEILTSENEKDAHRFVDAAAVLAACNTISDVEPTRPDGKPNRPLMGLCLHIRVVMEEHDEATKH